MLILFIFTLLNFQFIFMREGIIPVSYSYLQMSAFKQPSNSSLVWGTSSLSVSLLLQPGHVFPLIQNQKDINDQVLETATIFLSPKCPSFWCLSQRGLQKSASRGKSTQIDKTRKDREQISGHSQGQSRSQIIRTTLNINLCLWKLNPVCFCSTLKFKL